MRRRTLRSFPTSAWMGMLDPGDVSCTESPYGAPREDAYYFRGFRCCAD